MRISNLGQIERGSGIKRNETSSNGLPCIRYGEIYTTYDICAIDIKTKTSEQIFNRSHKASFGDLLITLTGETKEDIGKTIAYLGQNELAVGGDLAILKNHQLDPLFLSYFMASPYAIGTKSSLSTGDQIIHLGVGKLESILIPIPPKAEQLRIVRAIQSVNLKISELNDTYMSLLSIDSEITNKLQYSILKLAIQGKLVPQDPNDKPVQIQCKNPIIRRDNSYYRTAKGEEICIDEQLPFEIPSNWTWIGLFDICDVQYGYPFDSTKFNDNKKGVPLVRIRDLLPNKTKTFTTEIVSDEYFVNDEDMLIGMDGNFNLVYWSGGQAYLNQRVCKIKCKYESVNKQFIGLYLQYALKNLDNKSYTTVQHLSDKQLRSIIVPIPPYNEQNNIVEKYTKCILLTNQLSY